ncbi:hypothetical protein IPH25_04680 [bacterium]|nr:MAG: hypothetical protein IPG37_01675 [bacterium]QQR61737.1 MAG: hypothetical protein IPH25_04680 [bacterium]
MNQNNFGFPLFDLLSACLLFALILYVLKNNQSFLELHSRSLVHELDQSFADQLYSAQRHIRIAQQLFQARTETRLPDWKQTIDKISAQLADIEAKYGGNSPGVMFLGPIGTTSIILKEKELSQKLLEQILQTNTLLQALAEQPLPLAPATSVSEALHRNQVLISHLLKLKNR